MRLDGRTILVAGGASGITPPTSESRSGSPGLLSRRAHAGAPGANGIVVSVVLFAYADVMYATAVVDGKVVRFKLSPALARAHRENRGKTLSEREAVVFVEGRRRARALRRARPYLESRS